MKKTLLTIFSIAASLTSFAQTTSPSWTITQNSNFPITSAGIKYMDAVDANACWATGWDGGSAGQYNRAYCWVTRTNNGGTTWTASPVWQSTATPVLGDTSLHVISNIEGISGTTAWVAHYDKIGTGSQGGVYKTTDAGATWVDMTSAAMFTHTASFCNWVAFLTPNIGVVDGDPNAGVGNEHEIWRTTDGGTSWSLIPAASIPNPTGGEFGITNVYEKKGPSHVWFGTNKGRVYYSSDAGLTWNVSTLDATKSITDISFYDTNNGIAILYAASPSTLSSAYSTTDGGASWTLLPNMMADPNFGKADICGIPGTSWFASVGANSTPVENRIISFSSDNGLSWNSWGSTLIQYLTIDFVSPSDGWAGQFSDPTMANLDGWAKYNGGSLLQPANANFVVPAASCVSMAIVPTNNSSGNPTPSYTWTAFNPTGVVFSSSTAATPTIGFSNPGTYTLYLTAANSSTTTTSTRTITIAACTGLSEAGVNEFNFIVSPNPGKDVFHVSLPSSNQAYNVKVTNILGSVVYSAQTNINSIDHSIDLSGNKTGMYFMTISNNGIKTTKKIIIE